MKSGAEGLVVLVVLFALLFLFGGCTGCGSNPPPPKPTHKMPSAEQIGHGAGRVSGDATKGFIQGWRESWRTPATNK